MVSPGGGPGNEPKAHYRHHVRSSINWNGVPGKCNKLVWCPRKAGTLPTPVRSSINWSACHPGKCNKLVWCPRKAGKCNKLMVSPESGKFGLLQILIPAATAAVKIQTDGSGLLLLAGPGQLKGLRLVMPRKSTVATRSGQYVIGHVAVMSASGSGDIFICFGSSVAGQAHIDRDFSYSTGDSGRHEILTSIGFILRRATMGIPGTPYLIDRLLLTAGRRFRIPGTPYRFRGHHI